MAGSAEDAATAIEAVKFAVSFEPFDSLVHSVCAS